MAEKLDPMFERIQKLCKKNNISIRGLEKNAGLKITTVSHWKYKSDPKLSNVKLVANYFGVSLDYLVLGKKEGSNAEV